MIELSSTARIFIHRQICFIDATYIFAYDAYCIMIIQSQ